MSKGRKKQAVKEVENVVEIPAEHEAENNSAQTVQQIPVTLIIRGDNHRTVFAEEPLQELAQSIAEHGLAQPITVRPLANGQFEIVAGERRFRAMSQILNWTHIPALVRELNDEQAEAIMLAENVHREDLNPMDEARAYHRPMERFGWNIPQVARNSKVSPSKVRSRLELLKLLPDIQDLVAKGGLSVGYAERLAILDNDRQRAAVSWLQKQAAPPSNKVFGEYVSKLYEAQAQDSLFNLSFFSSPMVDEAVQAADGRLKEVLPRKKELPELEVTMTLGELADQYATKLMEMGKVAEAQVLVDFWCKAMDFNWMRLSPHQSQLLKEHGDILLQTMKEATSA